MSVSVVDTVSVKVLVVVETGVVYPSIDEQKSCKVCASMIEVASATRSCEDEGVEGAEVEGMEFEGAEVKGVEVECAEVEGEFEGAEVEDEELGGVEIENMELKETEVAEINEVGAVELLVRDVELDAVLNDTPLRTLELDDILENKMPVVMEPDVNETAREDDVVSSEAVLKVMPKQSEGTEPALATKTVCRVVVIVHTKNE